jgi:hypothetical protein
MTGTLCGRVALEDDVFDDELFRADAGAFLDGALDGLAVDAFLFGLLDGGKKARVHVRDPGRPFWRRRRFRGRSLAVARPFLRPATSRLAWSHCRPMAARYQKAGRDTTVGCGPISVIGHKPEQSKSETRENDK